MVCAIGILVLPFIFFVGTNSKIEHLRKRKNKEKNSAIVVRYQTDSKKIGRNHWQHTIFPIVLIINNNGDEITIKLDQNMTLIKPFKIGEIIHVFQYGGKFYHWDRYDRGILKWFPSSWKF